MWTLRRLLDHNHVQREIVPGVWVAARPEPGPLSWRLRDAWEVIRGRADAFTWPQADDPRSWCSIPRAASTQTSTSEEA